MSTSNFSPQNGDSTQSFSAGQMVLSRFKLNRVLGRGGMGVVWLAHDEKLERDVALKFLPAIIVNDRAGLTELKRETKRSLELTHPNIVRTYDFVEDSSIAGISMEFVDADTLRNRRIDQPSGMFQPADMGGWVLQLCQALDYAHSQAEIVHCDLKPANLMLNLRNQLKIADFGISRSLAESVTQITGTSISGTLVYMSPQQLSGEPPSHLDDVYAVGATLYELCTTRPPFYTGDIKGQIYGRIPSSMTERRQSLNLPAGEIPETWERTIAACLAKDASQRPQSAGAIAVGLGLMDAASLLPPRATKAPTVVRVPGSTNGFDGGPASGPFGGPASAGSFGAPPSTSPVGGPLSSTSGGPPSGSSTVVLPPLTSSFPAGKRAASPAVLAGIAAGVLLLGGLMWYFGFHRPAERDNDRRKEEVAAKQAADQKHADEVAAAEKKEAERLANARGSVLVKTEPPKASVKVGDGAPQKTPTVIPDLKIGTQTVEISLDGYEPVTKKVEIKENTPLDLGTIALVRSTGTLQIESQPPGLKVEIKSKADPLNPKLSTTPLPEAKLDTGDYDITVTREGWPPQHKLVTIVSDKSEKVPFEFITGSVTITCDTPKAKVVGVDGKELGPTPYKVADHQPGDFAYSIVAPGFDKFPGAVKIEAGEDATLPPAVLVKGKKVASSGTESSPSRRRRSSDDDGPPSKKKSRDNDDSEKSHQHTMDWMRLFIH